MIFGTQIKLAIGAGIILILVSSGYGLYRHGKSVAGLECTNARAAAVEAAVKEAKEDWIKSQSITSTGMKNVETTRTEIRYIQAKASEIEAPLCSDLGNDFSGVYNEAVRAIKAGTNTSRIIPIVQVPNTSIDGNATSNPSNTVTPKGSSRN